MLIALIAQAAAHKLLCLFEVHWLILPFVEFLPADDRPHRLRQLSFTSFACSQTGADVAAGHGQRLYRCKQDACPGGVQPESLCVQLGVVAHMAAGDHQMGKAQDILPAVPAVKA